MRSELNLFYEHSERLNVVGGVEARYSSVGANNITSATAPADETGATPSASSAATRSAAATSASMRRRRGARKPALKLVGGGRFDNNKIRQNGGYGTVFNPRLAGVLHRSATRSSR